ncbi:MAG TPA: undecaprenyl-diphosphate phosphatase [Vicinamibacterales bacterium]|nr:undecaprenyl-diphosphate phosphatase [Vicinamibacterales bacterium]
MTYFFAAVLGIVQGLTEFLPVSSTAHLLLGEKLLGFQDPMGAFTVMIQLGSILAIVWLYREKILRVIVGLPSDRDSQRFAAMIVIAVIPALVAGALFSDFVKSVLYESPMVFAWSFIIGGIVMLIVERFRPSPMILNAEHTSMSRALGVGLCQMLALIPGVSRSGATIVGGMLMGLDRPAAAEFSFFLAIPTMTAAFAHDLLDVRHALTAERVVEIAIGFVAAFIASLLVVRPFLEFIRRAGFSPFAWYRIALGVLILAALAAGWR